MSVVDELNKFGAYVQQQAKSNLSKKKKKDTSKLYNGINYKVTPTRDGAVLVFDFKDANDYWEFVDKGVKGVSSSSKAPNSPFKFGTGTGKKGGLTSGINGWVSRKRIQFKDRRTGQFLSYKSTAFLKRDGFSCFLLPTDENICVNSCSVGGENLPLKQPFFQSSDLLFDKWPCYSTVTSNRPIFWLAPTAF